MKQFIVIEKQAAEKWIEYINKFPLYPEDKNELESILKNSIEIPAEEEIEKIANVYSKTKYPDHAFQRGEIKESILFGFKLAIDKLLNIK